MPTAFISIGSNVSPETNIPAALVALKNYCQITGISTFYKTKAIGSENAPDFFNGVVKVQTQLPPTDLKYGVLRVIESELGRIRTADKNAPRSIDLDIIVYENLVINEPGLVLPDPEIPYRPFLYEPLKELAPDLALPGSDLKVSDMPSINEKMEPLELFTAKLRKEII